MHMQIEQAADNFVSMSREKQGRVREILGRYVQGEIGLEDAYYELLDNDLIPMPQRCGMHAKLPEDEGTLKDHIKSKLFS